MTQITLVAKGGQGGYKAGGWFGGEGAIIQGTFTLSPGETLNILVGQVGGFNTSDNNSSGAGGGGGSFVWTGNFPAATLLIAAGGGGGASKISDNVVEHALTGTAGNMGYGGWAGIMLRETLDPGSKKVSLKTQLTPSIRREIRSVTNGAASILNFNRPQHVWFRLTRSGSNFVGYTSADVANWSFAFAATVSMNGCIYAGLFAESINANVTTTATFDHVVIIREQNLAAELQQFATSLNGLSLSVYPNPGNGEMTLSVAGAPERNLQLEVTDMMGRMVRRVALPEGSVFTHPLDLSHEPAGVYFLFLRSALGIENVQRIVIQR